MSMGKITILGVNGHIGHEAAKAFQAAGWEVTGFGRSNKHPIAGVRFVAGNASNVEDMRRAIGNADAVFHGLNLPYHEWDKGRMETQTLRIIEAVGPNGRTLLFPGTIYTHAATDRYVTPDLPQRPEKPRGAIKVKREALLRSATERGDLQVVILRAGDFFGPDSTGDWFDQAVLREASKNRVAIPTQTVGHSWAYLPDLGRAFVRLAELRQSLAPFQTFHFAGHFATGAELLAAIQKAAPVPLNVVPFPWTALRIIGLAVPMMREVVKMRYLWENTMELRDERLDTLLGPGFGTPFETAIAETVRPFFPAALERAA